MGIKIIGDDRMRKPLVVYHRVDNDGWFSAALLKKIFPQATLVGWNYGDKPINTYDYKETTDGIIIADLPLLGPIQGVDKAYFELARDYELIEGTIKIDSMYGKPLLWFDHHKQNLDEVKSFDIEVNGMQSINKSAVALIQEWAKILQYIERGYYVTTLVSTFDTWNKEKPILWNEALAFKFASEKEDWYANPELIKDEFYDCERMHSQRRTNSYVEEGKIIMKYLDAQAKWLKTQMKEIYLFGYKVKCINSILEKSYFGDILNDVENDRDIICIWYYAHGEYRNSIRTKRTDIDLSEDIAKYFGGGGHPQASGFTTEKPIHEYDDRIMTK